MQQDIIDYDHFGFVPSRKIKSIDKYLRESEKKIVMLDKINNNSQELIKGNYQIEMMSDEAIAKFAHKFDTLPLPAIVAEKKNFKKIYKNSSLKARYTSFIIPGGIGGSHIYPDKKVNLSVPIIVNPPTQEKKDIYIAHENIHAFSRQWKSFFVDATSKSLEESMAYLVEKSPQDTKSILNIYGTIYSTIGTVVIAFPLVGLSTYLGYKLGSEANPEIGGLVGGVIGAVYLPMLDLIPTIPQLIKTTKLMNK
ncbi:MAG: hypothetical protein ABIB43_04160 [archaeon]